MKQRLYILLISLLTCASAAWAQTTPIYWTDPGNYNASGFSRGTGTQSDPYVIASAQDLARLAYDVNRVDNKLYKDTYFVQRADIDLSAYLWEPIGKDATRTFLGHYDGQGHAIKGMRIKYEFSPDWPVQNGLNSAPGYGLFGSVNGKDYTAQSPTIENVVLVDPTININCTSNNKLVRAGLLVGSLGSNSVLQNCNVQGGSITIDNLKGLTSGANMFIGGAVGDCAPGFAGSTGGSKITIKNISIDANITITPAGNATEQKQGNYQYNCGGIVGRMRYSKGPLVNCYYTGKIDAPQFIVSPSYGAVRSNKESGIANVFAGLFYDTAERTDTKVYFGDYKVKYKDQYRTITGNQTAGYSFTPVDGGTSALTQGTSNGLNIWSFGGSCPTGASSTEMYRAQGVNSCDIYVSDIDAEIDGKTLLERFNDNVAADMQHLIHWVNHTGKPHLHRLDDATMDSTQAESDHTLTIVFNDSEADDAHYHWTKTINGEDKAVSTDASTITIPEKTLANVVWSAYVSYKLKGDTSGKEYHSNTVTYHQPKNVDTFPTVAVSPSITGNTLTLTASLTDPASLILTDITYHWSKDGLKQAETTATLTTEAYTTTDINWEVYASFTHNGFTFKTAPAAYTQTEPVVTYTATENGEKIDIALAFETYGGALTDVTYCWDYNVYYDKDEYDAGGNLLHTEGDLKETIHHDSTSNTYQVSAVIFEAKTWNLYVKYKKGGVDYQSESVPYVQPAKAIPTLSVSKDEINTSELVMEAKLTPSYSTITPIYHWSKNGVEQTVGDGTNGVNDPKRTVPHAFDTQYWRCWATFTVDGKEYRTNEETYIYYSTLGVLNFHADLQADGKTVIAKLDDNGHIDSNVSVTYTWVDSKDNHDTGTSYTRRNSADWVEFTATITDKTDGTKQLIKTATYRFVVERNVVYIKYTGGGNDLNDGLTPDKPVLTWQQAYKVLKKLVDAKTTYTDDQKAAEKQDWDKNIIVIVDGSGTTPMLITADAANSIAATITGQWPWDGTYTGGTGRVYVSAANSTNGGARIGGPTRFKNVTFYGPGSSTQGRLCLWLNDTEFDEGVVMQNFGNLQENEGAIAGKTSPQMHLMLYSDQYASTTFPTMTKPMQLTIRSGRFGRIMAARIAGSTRNQTTYIIGRHDNPLMAKIEVDIADNNPQGKNADGTQKNYSCDIGYLCAGLTQGGIYADEEFLIKRGDIGVIVAGSQGNAIANVTNAPISSFFGRITVDIDAKDKDNSNVSVTDYYGACQGRVYGGDGICHAFFYGQSTLNLKHGTIYNNIFASAGGISGLVSPNDASKYTTDERIPYSGGSIYGVAYSKYDAKKTIVKVSSLFNGSPAEEIDLADTKISTNISGGVVEGSVYGGSYGYSKTLDAVFAPAHAGRLFGNTSVNISAGIIEGNVYGGGLGATAYFKTPNDNPSNTAKDTQKNRTSAEFKDVAQVYGDTHVTITGGTINGNIYGGGGGVASEGAAGTETEFLEIAKVYGNTHVTIDAAPTWEYRGTIYGGGALGGVEGNTTVNIISGTILGNVFGGSQGEKNHPNKAKVRGGTKVVVGQ